MHVYINPQLYKKLESRAAIERRSLSKQVEVMLEDAEKRSAKVPA